MAGLAKPARRDDRSDVDRPILIFGRNGQLARALRRSLLARGDTPRMVGSRDCDLADAPERCTAHIGGVRAVINASAFTRVDAAEGAEHANTALNARAPGAMAAACARAGLPFVHVSTDYVFGDTEPAPIPTDAPRRPLNAYGRAKAAGERAVAAAGGDSLVVRTSWVFDGTGANFLSTMLRLADTRDEVGVVADQIGRPTHAGHLAEAILAALDAGVEGHAVHHVQGSGRPVSWAGFARAIFEAADLPTRVAPIPTSAYPTPAARPAWSVLDTSGFEAATGHTLQDWRDGLDLALWEREHA